MTITSADLKEGLSLCPEPECAACRVARELLFLREKFNGGQPAVESQKRAAPKGNKEELMQTLVNDLSATIRATMRDAGLQFKFTFLARGTDVGGKNIVLTNDNLDQAAEAVRDARRLEQTDACFVVQESRPN